MSSYIIWNYDLHNYILWSLKCWTRKSRRLVLCIWYALEAASLLHFQRKYHFSSCLLRHPCSASGLTSCSHWAGSTLGSSSRGRVAPASGPWDSPLPQPSPAMATSSPSALCPWYLCSYWPAIDWNSSRPVGDSWLLKAALQFEAAKVAISLL